MQIVAYITQASVIAQILSQLRNRAATAAHPGARSLPSTRAPSAPGVRRDAPSDGGQPHGLSIAPTLRRRAGTIGARGGPTAASLQSPRAVGPIAIAQPRAREPRQRGGCHSQPVRRGSRRWRSRIMLGRPRLTFLSQ